MEGARRLAVHYMKCPTKEIRAPSAVFEFPKSEVHPNSKVAVPLSGCEDPKIQSRKSKTRCAFSRRPKWG
jgi:hypothetical protein